MVTSSTATFASVIAYLVGILNQLVGVLAAAAVLLFMWGAFQYVYQSSGGKSAGSRRKTMVWSLVALFILFSIWGILRIACDSLLASNCGTPNAGTASNFTSPSSYGQWQP
ncbi:MAG: hypothetical protein V4474_00920 [Patescibacteria group bacterium]